MQSFVTNDYYRAGETAERERTKALIKALKNKKHQINLDSAFHGGKSLGLKRGYEKALEDILKELSK